MVNVGKYTSPMDPYGIWNLIEILHLSPGELDFCSNFLNHQPMVWFSLWVKHTSISWLPQGEQTHEGKNMKQLTWKI